MNVSPFAYAGRLIQIFGVLCRQGFKATFRRLIRRPVQGPALLREACESLSGSYLKFGQILALQVDSLPREYCDALMSLLDRVPPFPEKQVERVFREELGAPPHSLYQAFNYLPFASASIGQVHSAILNDGTRVAVKVQRPGIRPVFERDLALLHAFARLIMFARIRSLYFVRDLVHEMSTWTRDELDYRIEASYCKFLGENAADTPTERIPNIHWDLTTSRILTMDFLDGPTITDLFRMRQQENESELMALREKGFDPRQYSSNIISNFLRDAFRFGLFHADLHPANLLILPNNVVGYVDFGIVATLTPEARRKQIHLTIAYATGDAESIYRQLLNISTPGPDSDLAGLRRAIARLTGEWYRDPSPGGRVQFRVSMTRTFADCLQLMRRYGILVDREMVRYIRSTILADGLIQRLAPGFDLARVLREVVEQYAAEESRNKIFSTSGALSLLTDLAVWLEARPRNFLQAWDSVARREFRVRTRSAPSPTKNRRLRLQTRYVVTIWTATILFLSLVERTTLFRPSPFPAVLTILFFATWSVWLARLLYRLGAEEERE